MSLRCVPAGTNVECTATAYNIGGIASRDVTQKATWLSSGASGSFPQPGIFVPAATGDVTIWARFEGVEPDYKVYKFLVSPGAPARILRFIGGYVVDAATNEKLTGATVRILDGYAAGKSATTDSIGHYTIEAVAGGESFTIEASREGYAPTRVTHSIDTTSFLDIKLQRVN